MKSPSASTIGFMRKSLTEDPKLVSIPEDPEDTIHIRSWLHAVIASPVFETSVGGVIVFNIICIICEADIRADCVGLPDSEQINCNRAWLDIAALIFQAVYTIEALLRSFVRRSRALKDAWFMFDLAILFAGYVDLGVAFAMDKTGLPGVQILRIFRVGRLLRGFWLMRAVPELHLMLAGFLSAMQSMFWGFFMILLLLILFAIVGVVLINPISNEMFPEDNWCHDAFTSVSRATLYFFQTLLGGDSWGVCAIPIVISMPLTFFFFAGALVCIQLGFANLVLATIVEKATEMALQLQQCDIEKITRHKEDSKLETQRVIHDLCTRLDADADGIVTYEELVNGFQGCAEVQNALSLLDIDKQDLNDLFHLMDADDSGDLTYDEVTRCIHKADTQDLKRQVMFVKLQLKKIYAKLDKYVKARSNQDLNTEDSFFAPFRKNTADQLASNVDPCSRPNQSSEDMSRMFQDMLETQFIQLQQRMQEEIAMLMKHIERTCWDNVGHRARETIPGISAGGHWVQPQALWGVPTDFIDVRSPVENLYQTSGTLVAADVHTNESRSFSFGPSQFKA